MARRFNQKDTTQAEETASETEKEIFTFRFACCLHKLNSSSLLQTIIPIYFYMFIQDENHEEKCNCSSAFVCDGINIGMARDSLLTQQTTPHNTMGCQRDFVSFSRFRPAVKIAWTTFHAIARVYCHSLCSLQTHRFCVDYFGVF